MRWVVIFHLLLQQFSFSQNSDKIWYFGNMAGLDFNSNPVTVLANGSMLAGEGCATISDNNGNLLFYCSGEDVWNKQHTIMANGTGLFGNQSPTQPCIIIKQPGNTNLYYIFTVSGMGSPTGLNYSIVDMALALGMGSVTVKNAPLYNAPCTEQMTGALHCNGQDAWMLAHEKNTNNFRAYLLTSAGVNTNAVISSVGPIYNGGFSSLKISPTGKKLLAAFPVAVVLFDFNVATGQVFNPLTLTTVPYAVACEFSPDGSKAYTTHVINGPLYQWDLCAGSATDIIASQYTIAASGTLGSLQLATNNKIYLAKGTGSVLGVINNPNVSGSGCNYVDQGQSVAPGASNQSLPNFIGNRMPVTTQPFTYTNNATDCKLLQFTHPATIASTCSAHSHSVSGTTWIFGDPASGSSNTSTLGTPTHYFTSAGIYTVKLVLQKTCNSDTITQQINVPSGPNLSITGNLFICKGNSTTLTAVGASSFLWNNNSSSSALAVSPQVNTNYTVVGTGTVNTCISKVVTTVTVSLCKGLEEEGAMLHIKIYPNPSQGEITVLTEEKGELQILDLNGNCLLKQSIDEVQTKINCSNLSNGIYTISFKKAANKKYLRLIILKE